jgi:hypothetical protein
MMLLYFVDSSAATYCDANLSDDDRNNDVAAVDRDDNDRLQQKTRLLLMMLWSFLRGKLDDAV